MSREGSVLRFLCSGFRAQVSVLRYQSWPYCRAAGTDGRTAGGTTPEGSSAGLLISTGPHRKLAEAKRLLSSWYLEHC